MINISIDKNLLILIVSAFIFVFAIITIQQALVTKTDKSLQNQEEINIDDI